MTQTQTEVFKAVDLLEMAKRAMPCIELDPMSAEEMKKIFKGKPVTHTMKDMDTGAIKTTEQPGYNQLKLDELESRLDVLVGPESKSKNKSKN